MFSILHIIFWLGVALLIHSYVFYPWLVKMLSRGKKDNEQVHSRNDALPRVAVLMAAYNEELVLAEKIESLLAQDYPMDLVDIFIGSDNSTDGTNAILQRYHDGGKLQAILFAERQGKPNIINQLVAKVRDAQREAQVYLMTDASVILEPDVLFQLARHFKNPKVGLVDAQMNYSGMKKEGISYSENTYLSSEVRLKHNESKLWGKMIGPFGGCFALRAELYKDVPSNFLVDDFYLAMQVLEEGYLAINELSASCHEPVSHESSEEFRRKRRISTGNFQNLFHFKHLLNPFSSLGFSFISHKVLRWLGPFIMIALFICSALLAGKGSLFFGAIVVLQLAWYVGIPLVDVLLTKLNIHLRPTRNIAYFNLMNWALLMGFFRFLGGVKSSVWTPTKRT